jgi:protein SCO1/2
MSEQASNNKLRSRIFVIVVAIALPLIFYYFFEHKVPPPPPAPQTYGQAPAFSLMTQDSSTLSNDDLKGFIYVADFFFTSCKTICPQLSEKFKEIQGYYKDQPRFKLVSFSINSEVDNVPVLREYAANYGAINNKWYFLTGSDAGFIRDSIAQKGFKVTVVPDDADPGQFTHTDMAVLVDGEGMVRGYYHMSAEGQMDSLYNAIERLLVEKKR